MVYRVIGLMSGSSLDGLDIAFVEFHENAGVWKFEIVQADCFVYSNEWINKLRNATSLSALDYHLLHTEYGHYIGQQVNDFIEKNGLHYQVALISSHGHTTFHLPSKKMTAQLGDGAAIAAETQLPVVTDLRSLDIAFGGQGAPIVPIGEKLLWNEYDYFLNIGGIANLSARPHPNPLLQKERAFETPNDVKPLQYTGSSKPPSPFGEVPIAIGMGDEVFIAFDICPANRVLNMLANDAGKEYDEEGKIAATGTINIDLLERLNALDYYKRSHPKSLANEFGTEVIYPMIRDTGCGLPDALRTYTEHIAIQIKKAIKNLNNPAPGTRHPRLLVTGGGAFNTFLIERIKDNLKELNIELVVPDDQLVKYKEALIVALFGVLRWRQEYNVLSSVTGALRDSIGGALWTGQEA